MTIESLELPENITDMISSGSPPTILLLLLNGNLFPLPEGGLPEAKSVTRVTKGWVELLRFTEPQNWIEEVSLHRHGLVPLFYEEAIQSGVREGLIEEYVDSENNRTWLRLTTEGVVELRERLRGSEAGQAGLDYYHIFDVISEILSRKLDNLVEEPLRHHADLKFTEVWCGGHRVATLFDWTDLPDGSLSRYHETLLDSLLRSKEGIRLLREGARPIYGLPTEKEVKVTGELTVEYILMKQLPSHPTCDLFEGKNYVANRWYLVEAIWMFQVLLNKEPSLSDIAFVTSINPNLIEWEKGPANTNLKKDKRVIHNAIRRDLAILEANGFVVSQGLSRKTVFAVTGRKFGDELGSSRVSLPLPSSWLELLARRKELYRKRTGHGGS